MISKHLKLSLSILILSAIAIAHSGCDSSDDSGADAIVLSSPELAGNNCPNGGQKITTGQDLNHNGRLDGRDPVAVSYVCNGNNGQQLFTDVQTEAPSPQGCVAGGYVIRIGLDKNMNGTWDPASETVLNTSYVCNGEDGPSTISVISFESSGANCGNGGIRIQLGIDHNRNGQLDSGEYSEGFACNGLNSLVRPSTIPYGSAECPAGGIQIESGLDLDGDGILQDNEVTNTSEPVCAELACEHIRYSIRPEYVCPDDAFPLLANMASHTRAVVGLQFGKSLVLRSTGGTGSTELTDNINLVDSDGDVTSNVWSAPYGTAITPRDSVSEMFGTIYIATNTDGTLTGKISRLWMMNFGDPTSWNWAEIYSAPNPSSTSRILSFTSNEPDLYFSTGVDQPAIRKVTSPTTSEIILPGVAALSLEADGASRGGLPPRLYFVDITQANTLKYIDLPIVSGQTPVVQTLYSIPLSLAHFPGYEPRISALAVDNQGRVYIGCGSAAVGANSFNSACTRGLIRVTPNGEATELTSDRRIVRSINYREDTNQLLLLMEVGATSNGFQLERLNVVR